MLEFKVIENLKPNKGLTDILKEFKYTVKLGKIKTILHTNLQVIIPTEYKITYPTTLTILEYKVNERRKTMRCGMYVRVSTDDQRDNGYSIDSQLRMIKEYCEKNEYDIVDVYNDAGHSGKDLMRPEMQRLLKDIKSKKIDKFIVKRV